jgi:ion channel-forming bestrophin family protein
MHWHPYNNFWRDAFSIKGSVTPYILPYVMVFGLVSLLICYASNLLEQKYGFRMALEVAPHEFAGAILGLLLILRTNAGYDRWWEARKLWGGIVNQSRNLAISAFAYGPQDAQWRRRFLEWTAAFPHAARCSLRGEAACENVTRLAGPDYASELSGISHLPSYVSFKIAEMLKDACDKHYMDRFAFMQIDKERAMLIDHIGACERILKTPLPKSYSIKIRRFITLFLVTLPFAVLGRVDSEWSVPLVTMIVAYPLISLDRIGVELQNPFAKRNLSHLPLDSICMTIESNLCGMLKYQTIHTEAKVTDSFLLEDMATNVVKI